MAPAPVRTTTPAAAWRPLLEVLRAPLLLSPISDVVAGWSVAIALAPGPAAEADPWRSAAALAAACLAGCCLLGAGMAQNALADRDDDRRRKPDRPLPRGAVSERQVRATFATLSVVALIVGVVVTTLLPSIVAIFGLTGLYHYVLKPSRVAGCLALGGLRGLDMGLGVVVGLTDTAAQPDATTAGIALAVCAAYALYIAGASLHASTDDEPGPAPWSRRGLGLSLAVLTIGALAAARLVLLAGPLHLIALGALLFAVWRLLAARRRLPPPAVTGVALSNLYLLGAGIAFAADQLIAGLVILALFGASRRLLRVFPPS